MAIRALFLDFACLEVTGCSSRVIFLQAFQRSAHLPDFTFGVYFLSYDNCFLLNRVGFFN